MVFSEMSPRVFIVFQLHFEYGIFSNESASCLLNLYNSKMVISLIRALHGNGRLFLSSHSFVEFVTKSLNFPQAKVLLAVF